MKLEKLLKINAPVDLVWKALMDIPYLVSCMPGIEKVEQTSENTFQCMVSTKVSYISATFDMTVNITKKIDGRLLETMTEGKGARGMGRLSQKQTVTLTAVSATETEALYNAELTLTGPLATFGQKAISAKFNEMADKFTARFVERFK